MTPDMAVASASGLPPALSALPTAVAVAALCVAVIVEIVAVPAILLPGGTTTLVAGALIGAGRPPLAVALPVVAGIVAGDQLAYFTGAAIVGWWRRRRPGRAARERTIGRGRASAWLMAAMPSLAGATGMPYRAFAGRMLVMRVPWLAAALTAGALAARSLARIGHVAGVAGVAASVVVVAGLLIAHLRPGSIRALARRTVALIRRLPSPPGT